jgi:hypothetical protein
MAAGTVQTVLVCAASSNSDPTGACPAGTAPATVQAYVIDPANSGYIDGIAQPFDYSLGSSYWYGGFLSLMGLFITVFLIRVFLDFLKRAF